MNLGALKIGETTFPAVTATLTASLDDPYWIKRFAPEESLELNWMLRVACGSGGPSFEGLNLAHESIRVNVRSWKQLSEQIVFWDEPLKDGGATSYILEYEDIPEGRIQFGDRKGVSYEVDWTGECSDIRRGGAFALNCVVEFFGVYVSGNSRESRNDLIARLERFLDSAELDAGEVEYAGHYKWGPRMCQLLFRPRNP